MKPTHLSFADDQQVVVLYDAGLQYNTDWQKPAVPFKVRFEAQLDATGLNM